MPSPDGFPLVHVMSYDESGHEEAAPPRVEDTRAFLGRRRVAWVNVNRATDPDMLAALERTYGIHPLTVEDIQNTHQRPKLEEYDGYLYVVVHMVSRTPEGEVETEQMSLLLGADWLITIQEKPGDIFNPVRDRIRQGRPRVRQSGPDYLMYAILDAIVDAVFPVLEALGREGEGLETDLLERGGADDARERLQRYRRGLLAIRHIAWAQRDAIQELEGEDVPYVAEATKPFLRDVADHMSRVIDFVETSRDFASDLMDLHMAAVAQRTAEVTKMLSIVATIFIPLTFIVGVYGMNFDYMPELRVAWAYPALLLAMAFIAASMLVAFRRRGWI